MTCSLIITMLVHVVFIIAMLVHVVFIITMLVHVVFIITMLVHVVFIITMLVHVVFIITMLVHVVFIIAMLVHVVFIITMLVHVVFIITMLVYVVFIMYPCRRSNRLLYELFFNYNNVSPRCVYCVLYLICNTRTHTAPYLVNTLLDGYEIEFPATKYVIMMKTYVTRDYPDAIWEDNNNRHVATLTFDRDKTVTIHIPFAMNQERKMWLFGDYACQEWYSGHFQRLFNEVYDIIREDNCTCQIFYT